MTASAWAGSAMKCGARLGLAAAALLVLGPFINRNFGIGDSSNIVLLPHIWESAPIAVLVSLICLAVLASCVLLSVALVTAAGVIRHAESRESTMPGGSSSFDACERGQ